LIYTHAEKSGNTRENGKVCKPTYYAVHNDAVLSAKFVKIFYSPSTV